MLQDLRSKLAGTDPLMSQPEPVSNGPALGAARVGAELRVARLRRGWALPEIAARLRIRLVHLEAIEDGRVADLPGSAYAVGFVRTYAGALGLDAGEVARRFRAEAQEVNRRTELAFPAPVPERGVPAGAVVLLGVLLAAGTYAGWYRFSGDARTPSEQVPPVPDRLAAMTERPGPPSNPSPQVASVMPSPGVASAPPSVPVINAAPAPVDPQPAPVIAAAAPSTPTMAAAATLPLLDSRPENRIMLRVKADSWIQVRERQGQVLLNRVLRNGETWPVPPGSQLLLTTGNAGGTELLVDGEATPTLGGAGAVRRDVLLDAEALKAVRPTPATSTARPQAQ